MRCFKALVVNRAKNFLPAMLYGLLVSAPPAIVLADDAGRPMTPSGRVELFNGKDFTGWTFASRSTNAVAETWSVTNGVIHCTGKTVGYLRTEKSFREYRLAVEWRYSRKLFSVRR